MTQQFGLTLAVADQATAGEQAKTVDAAARQKTCELKRQNVTLKYLLYLPKDYEQKPSWPLMLFLHGRGGRGDDLDLVRKLGICQRIEAGQDFPFIVVSPQSPPGQSWEPAELTVLLDEIVEKYKVDQDRIYVTGQSMGGFGTWALAVHSPDRFAAIVPICGGGDPTKAKQIAHIPAWVFHGAKDQLVSPKRAEEMVEALKKNGSNVKFTLDPNAGHGIFNKVYAMPELYEWLLQQKRAATPQSDKRLAQKPQAESNGQRDQRMRWWREARFGMFIHWGLYAIPAGEWNGKTNHAEWIRDTAHIPVEEYDKFVSQFNPVKFNADQWVSIAKNAGAKYIVITSKHHDGFCLFDSKYTDYNVMSAPFKRDIMKELADACGRQGVRMCWYHSIMDWHHPDYLPRQKWENRSAEGANFERYVTHLKRQLRELVTNYGKIGVLWFDGEWEGTPTGRPDSGCLAGRSGERPDRGERSCSGTRSDQHRRGANR